MREHGMTQMDHTNSKQWGGRAWRYREFKGAVGRCFDPYGRTWVQFEFAHEFEGWLRYRFHPETLSIAVDTSDFDFICDKAALKANASFVVTKRTGGVQYHLVLGHRDQQKRRRKLEKLARTAGGEVCIYTRAELRMDVALFWRLETLRQASQLFDGPGTTVDCRIVKAVQCGANTRDAIAKCLPYMATQDIVARLGFLHCAGTVILDFANDNYGVRLGTGGTK